MPVAPPRTVLVQLKSFELGGTQLSAVDLAASVEDHGYRSVLFAPSDTLPEAGASLLDVASVRGVDLRAYERSTSVFRGGATALSARARAIGADLIHVYGQDAEPRHAFWGPSRLGHRPFVHTVYEMAVDPATYRRHALVIGTGYLRDELSARPGPTTLISPPVDTERDAPDDAAGERFRRSLRLPLEREVVVIVSRLDRWMKAYPVEVAIRAMARLQDRDVALVIVGTGTDALRLRELAQRVERGLARRTIHFTGAMQDPRPAYAAADVVLGMGGSAARALAFARPLIVQGERGTAEAFTDATSTSLFHRSFWSDAEQQDADRVLASELQQLLDAPLVRARLGSFGRAFALEHFSLPAMARRLAEFYDDATRAYGAQSWLGDLGVEAPHLMDSLRRRARRQRPIRQGSPG